MDKLEEDYWKRTEIVRFWKLLSLTVVSKFILVVWDAWYIACEVYLLDKKPCFSRFQVISTLTLSFEAHKEA